MELFLLKICYILAFVKIICADVSVQNGDTFTKTLKNANGVVNRTTWHAYYDLNGIYSFLKNMSVEYPRWAQLVVGGHSFEGRHIPGVRINTPRNTGHKPVIFIESGIHAAEWLGPATATYFIHQLLASPRREMQLLRELYDWHIFPTANPDGYHYTFQTDRWWRKTRSNPPEGSECYGADPNRNWDYHWGHLNNASTDPCSDRYIGKNVFSEVETRTLSQYISRLRNVTVYLDFHSYAQMILIPYSDSTNHTGNYDDLVRIGKVAIEYGYKVSGHRYTGPKTAAELLYEASGSSMDWVRKTMNVPLVYCFELRGPEPLPPQKVAEQAEEVTQMILGLTKEAKRIGYL